MFPQNQVERISQGRAARRMCLLFQQFLLCIVAVALGSSMATAQTAGSDFNRELRVDMERAVENTLARLQKISADGETIPSLQTTAVSEEAQQDSLDSRFTITPSREIESFLKRYRRQSQTQIVVGLNRFAAYQPQIFRSFRREGVPPELALLGLVESGFDPRAISPKQARGIWQFVPETARRYGLRIGRGVDERTDPAKSTRAAARYLADLYSLFGDWPLALAAYNAGEARVLSAMARSGARDFWQLSRLGMLPAETRAYVPAVFATILFVQGESPHSPKSSLLSLDTVGDTKRERIFYATFNLSKAEGQTD